MKWRLVKALAAAAILLVLAVVTTCLRFKSETNTYTQAYGNVYRKGYEYIDSLLTAAREWLLDWDSDRTIALFTVFLFFATYLLWRATRDLVRGAEKTAERQLRAYVLVEKVTIIDFAKNKQPRIHAVMRNTGQTPAFKLHFAANATLLPYPATSPFVFNWPSKRIYSVIGPGAATTITIAPRLVLTEQDIADVLEKRTAIYVYGRIEYEDAFGRDQWSEFRVIHGGNLGPSANDLMQDCDEGNDASR